MKHNGFEYVDLGLPSGTKWARCNVGANSETDYGLYFAFGETNGYNRFTNGDRTFDRRNYKFSKRILFIISQSTIVLMVRRYWTCAMMQHIFICVESGTCQQMNRLES